MARSIIRRDVSLHLQQELFTVLERHAAIARAELSTDELALVLIEAACAMGQSAAATIAAHAPQAEGRAALFDLSLETITRQLAAGREQTLVAVAQASAAR